MGEAAAVSSADDIVSNWITLGIFRVKADYGLALTIPSASKFADRWRIEARRDTDATALQKARSKIVGKR